MRPKRFGPTALLIAGMAVLPAMAATHECVAGQPTSESYKWNFSREASGLLEDVRQDARQAQDHASELQNFATDPYISWEAHAEQLASLKAEINDMGEKLCRLQIIRRQVAPWQRDAIDRIASPLKLMADNATDAIRFANEDRDEFWKPAYLKYADTMYGEATQLATTLKQYEQFARIHAEDQYLEKTLGMKRGA